MTLQETIEAVKKQEIITTFKAFLEDTKSTEILIIILKSHLYLEREIRNILAETIVDDKFLNGIRFSQKLDLAYSLGLFFDIYGTLKKVNTIRNAYAHDIKYIFSEKEFNDLLSTLNKEDKDGFLSDYPEVKKLFFDENEFSNDIKSIISSPN